MSNVLITHATAFIDGHPVADRGVLITDDTITAIGASHEIAALPEAAGAEVIDAADGLLHASFADAHVHAIFGGVELGRLDISDCGSAAETLERIGAYAAAYDGDWILGGGWSMSHFPGGTPSRADLDRVVPDRPVFLINADHHGAWANSRAFELAGIDASTPDPADGRFERDADGTPSGTVHEGAQELFAPVLPPTTMSECRAGLLRAQERLLGYGITAWQEAILGDYAGYPDATEAYTAEIAAGRITADVSGALWVTRDLSNPDSPIDSDAIIADFEARRAEAARHGYRTDTAKIMVDGVAENLTAAMNEPYEGCDCAGGDARGLAYFTSEDLRELVPKLNARGFHAHFHAIGDRAVEYALDAVAAVPAADRAGVRNHIAHLQVVDPKDLPRFAALGVTANCQALWATLEEQMSELTLPYLGEERANWQYPFASLLRHGTPLAFGSDWPVSTPDPWQAIHVAVNRREPGVTDVDALLPAEALTLAQALDGYTRGSHRLLGTPDRSGAIEAGATADLALTDRDPFAAPPSEIWRTRNVLTLRRGVIVADAR